jgi:hypothetical protein
LGTKKKGLPRKKEREKKIPEQQNHNKTWNTFKTEDNKNSLYYKLAKAIFPKDV